MQKYNLVQLFALILSMVLQTAIINLARIAIGSTSIVESRKMAVDTADSSSSETRLTDCVFVDQEKQRSEYLDDEEEIWETSLMDDSDSDANSPGLTESGSERSIVSDRADMLELIKELSDDLEESLAEEEEDLSMYYFSDEDEEDSSEYEYYTEKDAIEYNSEAGLQRTLSDREGKIKEEEEIKRMLLQRAREEQMLRMLQFEHDQFDLESVKAIWLDELDTSFKLPGFTMVVTSHEDPCVLQRLCRA